MSDVSKLPKWAQERILTLERERDLAIRALNAFQDEQTPSMFYHDDWVSTGEGKGPSVKRRYVQTHNMVVENAGITLRIVCPVHSGSERANAIELQWSGMQRSVVEEIAFIPQSFCAARLVHKDNMR